jgi:hypothetical protein
MAMKVMTLCGRRAVLGLCIAVILAATRLWADFTISCHGMSFTPSWQTEVTTPDHSGAFMQVNNASCNPGNTCGLTSFEVDWDDGTFSSFVSNLPVSSHRFEHTYAANGLYHITVSADDSNGNSCSWSGGSDPIDIWVH